jgi:hypothetical protein
MVSAVHFHAALLRKGGYISSVRTDLEKICSITVFCARGQGIINKIRMINSAQFFLNSQASKVHKSVANTEVKSKQKLDQQLRRYNNFKKEEGMLSNFHNHIVVVYR